MQFIPAKPLQQNVSRLNMKAEVAAKTVMKLEVVDKCMFGEKIAI